jgi:hypothetical protein
LARSDHESGLAPFIALFPIKPYCHKKPVVGCFEIWPYRNPALDCAILGLCLNGQAMAMEAGLTDHVWSIGELVKLEGK